ncbi:MAG: hypothetical protein HKN78_10980 [Sphingomonadaceae bacterium]|nr:hypothetical protein [Sphingomonadaceae bacterium]
MQTLDELIPKTIGAPMLGRMRDALMLPDISPGFDDLPPTIVLLLFSSRSGSTYASRLLAKTPHFNSIREAFNPEQLSILRNRHGLKNDAEAALWSIDKYRTQHAFAAKCGLPGLASAYHVGFLEAVIDRACFIAVKRRDRVAQAVSIVKAELSGRFHSNAEAKLVVTANQYDRERIGQWHDVIERSDNALESFTAAIGRPAPVFWYEDICDDPAGFVDAAVEAAGLSPAPLTDADVGLNILRDEINAEWVARYKAGD